MDNKKGEFIGITSDEFIEQMKNSKPLVFREGEILEIRGSRFRVQKIGHKKMILKLLPSLENKFNKDEL